MLNYIWDVFGDSAELSRLKDNSEQIEFVVHTTADAAKIFAKQYCDGCELVAPEYLRKKLQDEFTNVLDKYK